MQINIKRNFGSIWNPTTTGFQQAQNMRFKGLDWVKNNQNSNPFPATIRFVTNQGVGFKIEPKFQLPIQYKHANYKKCTVN